jgi:hypothetical protein
MITPGPVKQQSLGSFHKRSIFITNKTAVNSPAPTIVAKSTSTEQGEF